MRLWAAGMQIHSTMKTTSPYLTKAAMILAALFVTATAWWVSWHHQESAKQVEQARAANQKLQAQVAKLQAALPAAVVNEDDVFELRVLSEQQLAEVVPTWAGG